MKARNRVLLPYLLLATLALAASFPGSGQSPSSSPEPTSTSGQTANTTSSSSHTTQTSSTTSPTPTNTTRTNHTTTPTETKTTQPFPSVSPPTYSYEPNETNAGPAPTPTPPPRPENYTFELIGQRVAQDVWISGAQRVVIRDSVILGRLGIAYSKDVTLADVDVSRAVTFDHVEGAHVDGLSVAGPITFSNTRDFSVDRTAASLDLGCTRCVDGVYRDTEAGGQLLFKENLNVDTSGVRAVAAAAFTTPTFAKAEEDAVRLNITNTSVSFRTDPELAGSETAGAGEARLDVSTSHAVARLEFTPPDHPDQTAVEVESRFEKLQEYEDRDADAAYDLGDLVIREYLIDELPVSNLLQERLGGDRPGWRVRVDYALPPGGTFGLIYTAYDDSGDQTKIDVEVAHYAYASDSSRLALQVRLASASDWRIERGAAEDRLVFLGQGYDGFFAWLHTAQADGVDTPVTAQVLEEHRDDAGLRELVLFLGYERADVLVHDPSIGVLAASVNLPLIGEAEIGNVLVYTSTLVAAIVVLWAMGKTGRRRP